MNKFFLFLFLSVTSINPILSQSTLLESVKKNPADAIKICNKFKAVSYTHLTLPTICSV